jgi:hypothetical protein
MNKGKKMTKAKLKPQSETIQKTTFGGNQRNTTKPSKATKKARLISLLGNNTGSDVASISKKFGWLPHTTRAALSRLRKAGYEITGMKMGAGKPTKYRITSAPAEQSPR